MYKFIINESAYSSEPQVTKKSKDWIEFIAVLQEAERKNRNGRIYPRKVLEEAMGSPYIQERLKTLSLYGEAGHPLDTSPKRQMYIDQQRISHIIKETWWEGNLLKARVMTANTQAGRDLKGLIEQGSQVAFSLRAQGNVKKDYNGNTIVESPIHALCYDWVINPSHDKAFLESICEGTKCQLWGASLTEDVDFNFDDNEDKVEKSYDEGRLIEINESDKEFVDYAKYSNLKFKKPEQVFKFTRDHDRTISEDRRFVTTSGPATREKVQLDEYIVKDIRNLINSIREE
jgi:hypothetical protein